MCKEFDDQGLCIRCGLPPCYKSKNKVIIMIVDDKEDHFHIEELYTTVFHPAKKIKGLK